MVTDGARVVVWLLALAPVALIAALIADHRKFVRDMDKRFDDFCAQGFERI